MKKGYKPAQQTAELMNRRVETFHRFIRGEKQTSIAKDYGLSLVVIGKDIRIIRDQLQQEMRDELLGIIAESYAVYKEIRTWAFNILADENIEMRERISAANLLIRAQQRIDKLTGAESPEKMLIKQSIPDIRLTVHYPDGREEIIQDAKVVE